MAEPIEVDLNSGDGFAAVVTLCGEHDLATSIDVEAALAPLYGNVLIDLTQCEFIDSTVIGVLIRHGRSAEREGHRIEITCEAGSQVARVLDIVKIDHYATLHVRESAAAERTPNADEESAA